MTTSNNAETIMLLHIAFLINEYQRKQNLLNYEQKIRLRDESNLPYYLTNTTLMDYLFNNPSLIFISKNNTLDSIFDDPDYYSKVLFEQADLILLSYYHNHTGKLLDTIKNHDTLDSIMHLLINRFNHITAPVFSKVLSKYNAFFIYKRYVKITTVETEYAIPSNFGIKSITAINNSIGSVRDKAFPKIKEKDHRKLRANALTRTRVNLYKPSRLNTPLFPLPLDLLNFYKQEKFSIVLNFNPYSQYKIDSLYDIMNHTALIRHFFEKNMSDVTAGYRDTYYYGAVLNDMNSLMMISTCPRYQEMTYETDYRIQITQSMVRFDCRTINQEDVDLSNFNRKTNHPISKNIVRSLINKMRYLIAGINQSDLRAKCDFSISDIQVLSFVQGLQVGLDHANQILYFNSDNYNTIVDTKENCTYFIDNAHMDYLITTIDSILNMKCILLSNEYEYANDIIENIFSLINLDDPYSNKVEFMKSFESLCLMKADLEFTTFINYEPIVEVIFNLNYLSPKQMLNLFFNYLGVKTTHTLYDKFIYNLNNKEALQLCEISALHKSVFYSEIDETKGITKFLKRVHTERIRDNNAINESLLLFRKLFISNYYAKYQRLPAMELEEDLKYMIENFLKDSKHDYNAIPLSRFNNITFSKSFEDVISTDPLLNAKDKSCSASRVSFGNKDSVSELREIIERNEYSMSYKIKNELPLIDNYIYVGEFKRKEKDFLLRTGTKLCMKEREQKKEGRLFGCATLEYKHELSYYNQRMNKIIDLFKGQFINIANSDKKREMHEASQLLLDKDTYSIMLDIEGHNQSIQEINMYGLLSDLGRLLGLPELVNIARYFQKLDVYYTYHYLNKTIFSHGQKGGIEGWMNPLWTLITLLYTEMLSEYTNLEILKTMVYSDDVCIIVKFRDFNQTAINSIYDTIVTHYKKFGFTIKPSQTIISKYRSTLLKVHYFNGQISDMSLKKILSISSISETLFVNEALDSQVLNSSINSALEYSMRIKCQLFIKWYRLMEISLKSFLYTIGDLAFKKAAIILDKDLKEILIAVSQRNRDLENFQRLSDNDKELEFHRLQLKYKDLSVSEFLSLKYHHNNRFIDYCRSLKDNTFLMMCLYIKLILPENAFGYNVSTLNNSLLTASSDNQIRKFDELFYLVKSHPELQFEQKFVLVNIMFQNVAFEKQLNEVRLLSGELPIFAEFTSSSTMLKSAILTKIKKINRNKDFAKYLSDDVALNNYHMNTINLFRKKFHYRIVSTYLENSIFKLQDVLFDKLETSRSFVKKMNIGLKLHQELYRMNTITTRELMTDKPLIDPKIIKDLITSDKDIVQFLLECKYRMYNNIKFIQINEPMYLNRLTQSIDNYLISVKKTNLTIRKDNLLIYKHFHVPKGLTIKYADDDYSREDLTLEIKMALHNVYITKWLLSNDNMKYSPLINYVEMCNVNLSAFTDNNYLELEHLVKIPTGGEILHRIDNMRFQDVSFIKSLHEYCLQLSCEFNYNSIIRNYSDSNINNSYLKNLIILKEAFRIYNTDNSQDKMQRFYCSDYTFKNWEGIIENVCINFSSLIDRNLLGFKLESFRKFNCKSTKMEDRRQLILASQHLEYNSVDPYTLDENRAYDNLVKDINGIYADLNRDMIWASFTTSPDTHWIKIKEKLDANYTYVASMTYNEFIGFAQEKIDNYFKEIRQTNNVNIQEIQKILNLDEISNNVTIATDKYVNNFKVIGVKLLNARKTFNDRLNAECEYQIRQFQQEDMIIKKNVARKLALEILIKYCTCFEIYANKGVRILIGRTMSILMDLIKGKDLRVHNTLSYIVITILGQKQFEELLKDDTQYLKSKINEMNRLLKLHYSTNLKSDYTCNIPMEVDHTIIPIELVNNIQYLPYSIDSLILKHSLGVLNKINQFKRHVMISSDPNSFYSLTGSDSLVAGLGIGKYIKSTYSNDLDNKKICDLTSGRGDFHLAFSRLGITHTSFGLKDYFSLSYKIPGIIRDIKYDLTKYDTLAFVEQFDIIVIDISFIQGDPIRIIDTINNLIPMKKHIILRINSFKVETLNNIIHNISKYSNMKLLVPQIKGLRPYQIYLDIRLKESIEAITNQEQEFAALFRNLFSSEVLTLNISKMSYQNYNSINLRLRDEINNNNAFLNEFDKHIDCSNELDNIHLLIDHLDTFKYVSLPVEYAVYFGQPVLTVDASDNMKMLLDQDFIIDITEHDSIIKRLRRSQNHFKVYDLETLRVKYIDEMIDRSMYPLLVLMLKIYKKHFVNDSNINEDYISFKKVYNYEQHSQINMELNGMVEQAKLDYEIFILMYQALFNSSYEIVMMNLLRSHILYYKIPRLRSKYERMIKGLKFCSYDLVRLRHNTFLDQDQRNKVNSIYTKLTSDNGKEFTRRIASRKLKLKSLMDRDPSLRNSDINPILDPIPSNITTEQLTRFAEEFMSAFDRHGGNMLSNYLQNTGTSHIIGEESGEEEQKEVIPIIVNQETATMGFTQGFNDFKALFPDAKNEEDYNDDDYIDEWEGAWE